MTRKESAGLKVQRESKTDKQRIGHSTLDRTGNRGQTGSYTLSETTNRYEPNESCQANVSERPVCPGSPGPT